MNVRTFARIGTAIVAAGVIGTLGVGLAQADSTAVDPNAGIVIPGLEAPGAQGGSVGAAASIPATGAKP